MHDDQNLFDPQRGYIGQSSRALETLNFMIENGKMQSVIVVAIDNSGERHLDYTPNNKASLNMNFITQVIMPQIEGHF